MAQSRAFGAAAVRSGLGDANVVYGFTSAGLELLERAKADGIHGVLEQFIASQPFRDDLLADERAAFPDWEPVQETLKNDKAYRDRLHREWTLADTIICPSRFVSDSLVAEGVDPAKLVVVPYGVAMPSEPIEMRQLNGPLRVLFIGTVELRKGVHYLTEALGMLDPGSFHAKVAGPVRLSKTGTSRLSAVAEVLGQVPRSEVGALFNWADVFVLPSLVEGSATVIYEALVRGVPVICTPNAGSIVDDGRTGLLVAPRNASSLADALNRLAMEPDFLDSLRQTAKAERHAASLEKYEENLLAALRARLAKVV
jgi:glycosyltransferase involved in cell wall biosynthesis